MDTSMFLFSQERAAPRNAPRPNGLNLVRVVPAGASPRARRPNRRTARLRPRAPLRIIKQARGPNGLWPVQITGASNRTRTDDPRFTRAVLYQLSYAGGQVRAR